MEKKYGRNIVNSYNFEEQKKDKEVKKYINLFLLLIILLLLTLLIFK